MTDSTESLTLRVSGVDFANDRSAAVAIETTFIEPGRQLQMMLLGAEPAVAIQPSYDADDNEVTFIVTAVGLDPIGLEEVLGKLHDAATEMADQQRAEQSG